MDEVGTRGQDALWKRRYRARQIFSARIAEEAPDRGLAVTTDATGVIQLHAWDVPAGTLRPLTQDPNGVPFGFLSPDGGHVYYLDDPDGDEIGHLVRIPFAGGALQDVTPDLPPYSLLPPLGAVSRDGSRLALTIADEAGFALLVIDLLAGNGITTPRLLHRDQAMFTQPILSQDGALAVVASTERTGDQHYSLIAFDTATGKRTAEIWDGPESALEAFLFSPLRGDERLLGTTTHSGFMRPLLWHPRTGDREDLPATSDRGDVMPFDWSPDGTRVLLCHVHQAEQQLAVVDLPYRRETLLDRLNGTIGASSGRGAFFVSNDEMWAEWEDATHPPQIIALDGRTGAALRTVLAADPVPPSRPWQSVSCLSSDEQTIQGWLALPAGSGPFPTVLDLHGGPEYAQTELFSPSAQSWLDHGFAYLSINYRGSTTFGREFQEKIWGCLGQWESEDIVAARNWLIDQGIAPADQIILSGASYGGYLTLLALGQHPELWAAGIAEAAITDWTMLYEDAADFVRGYLVAMFGGMPEEKPEAYAVGSPLTYAARVQAPVLIIQGCTDSRSPARPIKVYVAELEARGVPVEVAWYDSGHMGGSTRTEQAIAHQELALRFAESVLGNERK